MALLLGTGLMPWNNRASATLLNCTCASLVKSRFQFSENPCLKSENCRYDSLKVQSRATVGVYSSFRWNGRISAKLGLEVPMQRRFHGRIATFPVAVARVLIGSPLKSAHLTKRVRADFPSAPVKNGTFDLSFRSHAAIPTCSRRSLTVAIARNSRFRISAACSRSTSLAARTEDACDNEHCADRLDMLASSRRPTQRIDKFVCITAADHSEVIHSPQVPF